LDLLNLGELEWRVSEQGRAVAREVIAAALTPVLGPEAAQLAAATLSGPVLEQLLARVTDAPGVEVDACEVRVTTIAD
jgi:hypothetical protein